MIALTTQLVFWKLFPIAPVNLVYLNYETGNCNIQFFAWPNKEMFQIIGNVNEVRATSIFYLFDINFFRAKFS